MGSTHPQTDFIIIENFFFFSGILNSVEEDTNYAAEAKMNVDPVVYHLDKIKKKWIILISHGLDFLV